MFFRQASKLKFTLNYTNISVFLKEFKNYFKQISLSVCLSVRPSIFSTDKTVAALLNNEERLIIYKLMSSCVLIKKDTSQFLFWHICH